MERHPPTGAELPQGCLYRGDELCVVRDSTLYSWDRVAETWRDKGVYLYGRERISTLARDGSVQSQWDIAELGEYLLVTWSEEGLSDAPVFAAVYDRETLSLVTPIFQLTAGGRGPLVAAGDDWAIFIWWVIGSSQLRYSIWEVGAQTVSPDALLVTLVTNRYTIEGNGANVLIAYQKLAGTEITVEERNRTTVIQSVVQTAAPTTAGADGFALIPTPQTPNALVVLAWVERSTASPDDLTVRYLDSALALISSSTKALSFDRPDVNVFLAGVERDSTRVTVVVDSSVAPFATDGAVEYAESTFDGTTATLGTTAFRRGVRLLGAPVAVRNRVVTPVHLRDLPPSGGNWPLGTPPNPLTASQALLDIDSETLVGRGYLEGPGYARFPFRTAGTVSHSVRTGDDMRFVGAYFTNPVGPTLSGSATARLVVHDCDFTARAIQASTNLQVAHSATAGFLLCYDGTNTYEQDFHQAPNPATGFAVAGVIPPGTYSYAFLWEWEDVYGRVYRSAPTLATITLAGAGEQVNFTVVSLHNTRRSAVRLLVARTQEAASGDPTYYRLDDPAAPTLNDKTAQTFSFSDNNTDASIIDNEPLDEVGPAPLLPFVPTPATDFAIWVGDRLWCGTPERTNVARFSLPQRAGFGLERNDTQAVRADTERRITGVSSQDRSVFLFTRQSIHFTSGVGPDGAGVGPQFVPPAVLPSEIGATDQNNIVVTPYGVLYTSTEGPRMLSRARGGPDLFSAVTEAWRFLGQTSTATIYRPDKGEAMFFDDGPALDLDDLAAKRGTLRYHFATQRFSHDTRHQAVDAATAVNGESAFVRTDGRVCVHNLGFLDGTERVPLVFVSPWLRVNTGLAPHQKIRYVQIGGVWLSEHNLVARVAKNYNYAALEPAVGFDPQVTMDPARDGLRDPPQVWTDTSGANYLLRWQIAAAQVYSFVVAVRLEPLVTGPAAAISWVELIGEGLEGDTPLDRRRTY